MSSRSGSKVAVVAVAALLMCTQQLRGNRLMRVLRMAGTASKHFLQSKNLGMLAILRTQPPSMHLYTSMICPFPQGGVITEELDDKKNKKDKKGDAKNKKKDRGTEGDKTGC